MTTIAWDGKVLVADRQTNVEGSKVIIQKIHALPQGGVASLLGVIEHSLAILNWLKNPHRTPADYPVEANEDDAGSLVVVNADRSLDYYQNKTPWPVHLTSVILGFGTGGAVAMGAMLAGKSAEEAVQIAIQVDSHSGLGYSVGYPKTGRIKNIAI